MGRGVVGVGGWTGLLCWGVVVVVGVIMLQAAAVRCGAINGTISGSGVAAPGRAFPHPGFKFTVMSVGVLSPLMSVLLLSELLEEQRERTEEREREQREREREY